MSKSDNKKLVGEFFAHHPHHKEVHVVDGYCFYVHSDAQNHKLTNKLDELVKRITREDFEAAEKAAKKPAPKAVEKPAEADNDNPPIEGEAQTSPVDAADGESSTPETAPASKGEAEVEVVRSGNPDLTDVESRGRTTQPKARTTNTRKGK